MKTIVWGRTNLMTASWKLVLLLSAVFHTASGQSNGTQSGCEVCARTGDCSRAYQGAQGQFCGNWLDRQNDRRPCCCPDNAVCKVSNYACNCGYVPYGYRGVGNDGLLWLWWLLGALGLFLCCSGCCVMLFRRSKERETENSIPMAAPVSSSIGGAPSSQPYGTTPAYANAPAEPVYAAPAYGRSYGRSGGGMGAGTGAALGGTAGLLGGLWLGETLADHGDGGGFGDGGLDGGGGFDGGGDFGGDF